MKKILFFLLFTSLFAGEGVLFYFQDAGELYGLLPVAKSLLEKGVDVQILAAGTAESLLAKSGEEFLSLHLPVNPADRSQVLSTEEIEKILAACDPAVFVSGVAFTCQGQLFTAFGERGVETVAFWDNFNADGADLYFKTAHAVEQKAVHLWISSERLAKSDWFESRKCLFVSGHPSLEKWVEEAASVNKDALRQKLPLTSTGRKTAVFIGGYGEAYEEAFELFLRSIENLDIDFLIQPHPKYSGSIEERVFARTGLNRAVRILKNEITTLEAIVLSDIVLCHQSTVGFQALFLQKTGHPYPSPWPGVHNSSSGIGPLP